MSFSYERHDFNQRRFRSPRSQRSVLGYWLPLGLTVAAATIGFAAWVWSERSDSDEDSRNENYYERRTYEHERKDDQWDHSQGPPPPQFGRGEQDYPPGPGPEMRDETIEETEKVEEQTGQEDTFASRVSDVMRRTPSPQQFFDGASKRVAAGVAAAGAAVGKGISAMRETDDDFQDHERWSAEAETRAPTRDFTSQASAPTKRSKGKRLVAVVVSAAGGQESLDTTYEVDHASILSHLPSEMKAGNFELVVLIYAPHLKSYPLTDHMRSKPRPTSSTSSYSDLAEENPATTPDANNEPNPPNALYESLQSSALQVVPHPTNIMPFTTPTGHVYLLRNLAPSLVYMEESLSGPDGENVNQIEGWVGQIVVVIGGEGLVDTETEDEGTGGGAQRKDAWWKNPGRVGLGKADIVEGSRFTEDWIQRVDQQ